MRLRGQLASTHDSYWIEQLDIQSKAAGAWIELGNKRLDEAIESMHEAADREDRTDKHVAMENRLSPMRELLRELLLEAKRPDDAVNEFEISLRTTPNRFRSLAGAAHAAELSGDRTRARIYYNDWWHWQAARTGLGRPSRVQGSFWRSHEPRGQLRCVRLSR